MLNPAPHRKFDPIPWYKKYWWNMRPVPAGETGQPGAHSSLPHTSLPNHKNLELLAF